MANNDLNDDRWVEDRLAVLNTDAQWQPDAARAMSRLRARRGRSRRWTYIAAGAAVTSMSLMAFPVTRAFAQRCVAACVGESSRLLWPSFTIRSTVPKGLQSADARALAPDFMLNDASGIPVRLSDLRGKVVLLNFWATWCAPCNIEIPWFAEFQRDYASRGFVVLGVSLDGDGWKAVKPYMETRKVDYRVMIGNEDLTKLYGGVTSLPTTLIIDRSGRIAVTHTGLCSEKDYEGEINALLSE